MLCVCACVCECEKKKICNYAKNRKIKPSAHVYYIFHLNLPSLISSWLLLWVSQQWLFILQFLCWLPEDSSSSRSTEDCIAITNECSFSSFVSWQYVSKTLSWQCAGRELLLILESPFHNCCWFYRNTFQHTVEQDHSSEPPAYLFFFFLASSVSLSFNFTVCRSWPPAMSTPPFTSQVPSASPAARKKTTRLLLHLLKAMHPLKKYGCQTQGAT